jgi:hypothetical protein
MRISEMKSSIFYNENEGFYATLSGVIRFLFRQGDKMKPLFIFLILFFAIPAFAGSDATLVQVYGSHSTACTATAVDSSNANLSGPFVVGKAYLIYGYASATDFTGIPIKCLAGGATVNVNGAAGVKLAAGEKQVWVLNKNYLSCQTGSGSGFYDVCKMD